MTEFVNTYSLKFRNRNLRIKILNNLVDLLPHLQMKKLYKTSILRNYWQINRNSKLSNSFVPFPRLIISSSFLSAATVRLM